jgi:hypothetical protein
MSQMSINKYAEYLAKRYRAEQRCQKYWKSKHVRDTKETKTMIADRQKAKAVLLEGDPDPYEYQVAFKLEKDIASLKTLLPKPGRPFNWPLGLAVASLAVFVKERTGRYHWELTSEVMAKHLRMKIAEPRLWASKIANRFWQWESEKPKGPTEITFNFAPLPQSPPQRPPQLQPPPNSTENELLKILH